MSTVHQRHGQTDRQTVRLSQCTTWLKVVMLTITVTAADVDVVGPGRRVPKVTQLPL